MTDGAPVSPDATTRTVKIVNARGLHARAAAKLSALAEEYECEISVCRGSEEVSARSIMGLLMLAAAKDSEIAITANGGDATAALDALCSLVEGGFGEDAEGAA